jgi:hypothetical protein
MTATSPRPARVDFHHHLFPTGELAESVRGSLGANNGWRFPDGATRWTPETSLVFMDVLGIQLAVLSLPNDMESTLPRGTVGHSPVRSTPPPARPSMTIPVGLASSHTFPPPPTSTPPSRS